MSDTETTTNSPTIWPALTCKDAEAELRFLQDAFGFEEALVVRGEGGDDRPIHHAELKWPLGGGVMFGSSRAEDDPFPTGPVSIYVVCDDPDVLLERATKAGAEIVLPITDENYGSRGFSARDPEGNVWSFGTYRGA